jgi:lipoyl(octanoyl) transferase
MIVKHLGLTDYETTWQAMKAFTAGRTAETMDELWVTEHPPVYTLGLNRKDVRAPWREDIPVVLTDRGGKITYHGPGQVVVYFLLDMKRRGWTIRQLVDVMEGSIIRFLVRHGVDAAARPDAPGVYVDGRKIASLGLRIKHGCCYHGLSLNVDMDLSPFLAIDPCGYQGMQVTQTKSLGIADTLTDITDQLIKEITAAFRKHSN